MENSTSDDMVSIESESDLKSLRNVFEDLWSSATVRLSLVEVGGTKVPNGEIIFHRDSRPEETNLLYSIDGFEIYEETVSNPFEVVQALFDNCLRFNGDLVELDFRHFGNVSGYFQTGTDGSRVFSDRSPAETNTAFKPELPNELEEKYQNAVAEIDEQIKTADEPFFDLAKCEYYYFEHHFRGKSTADPLVLIFADSEFRFEVGDENEFELQFPHALADKTTIIGYPQRPFGKQKGWKILMEAQEFQTSSDGIVTYADSIDMNELQEVYLSVYVENIMVLFERHYNSEVKTENDRFRIFDRYDQRGDLLKYLQGKDPRQFEVAVLNLLGIAGYTVQWLGDDSFSIPNYSTETNEPEYDEIDLIAYAPDGSHIAFVECTNKRISEKTSLLDRIGSVTSDIIGSEKIQFGPDPSWAKSTIPCIATPQSPEELNPQVVENLEDMGITVLDSDKLIEIYHQCRDHDKLVRVGGEPGYWMRNSTL